MRLAWLRTVAVSCLIMVALLLPARASVSAQPARAGLPTLRWNFEAGLGGAQWPTTFDPALGQDPFSLNVLWLVDANLVKMLPNGDVINDLAQKIAVSKNRRVYTFTLRPNARFSNGDRVTAQDVQYSLTRALSKSTASPLAITYDGHIAGAPKLYAGKTHRLSGVRVLNSHTVQITIDKPIAYFLKTLVYPTADIVDPRVVAGKKPGVYFTNTCKGNVGAGPFMFHCLNGSSNKSSFYPSGTTPYITLVPNPYYYGRKPHINVDLPIIADTETNYRLFQANGIDGTGIPSTDISANEGKPGFIKYPSSVIDYIDFNQNVTPFNNVHCRLAISYAVNRDALNNDVRHRSWVSTYSVVPRGFLGYSAGNNNPHFDLNRAKAELAKCPGGIHNVQMPYQHTSSDFDNEYRAIQAMLSQAGITIKLQPVTYNGWLNVVGQPMQNTHTLVVGDYWQEDYPDPVDYCTLLLRAGQLYDIGNYNNPRYNKLVDAAEIEGNPKKRAQLYIEAQHIALSDGAWTALGNANGHGMVKPYVHGIVGAEAFNALVPRNNDWANVSISKH